MAKQDLHNPIGSDVVEQKLREERRQKKAELAKRRQGLISFEVASEPTHTYVPPKMPKSVPAAQEQHTTKEERREAKAERNARTVAASPRWKRTAIVAIILLLIVVFSFFANNYRKNVYIENLKSANEEFARAYEEQQGKIAELERRLAGDSAGS